MPLKTTIYRGHENKPAIIFIHGLGMDKNIWVNPHKSSVLAGEFSITTLLRKRPLQSDKGLHEQKPKEDIPKISLGEQPDTLRTLFHELREKDYTVVTWSQKRPAAPIDDVVLELKKVVEETNTFTKAGIILIGHSRGGLVGRKYLSGRDRSIRGLITISTPHKGSSLAKVGTYLSPLAKLLIPLLSDEEKGLVSFAIKRISEFFRSKALKELLPESACIQSLNDEPCEWVSYATIGGTKPTLFRLYKWKWNAVREGDYQRWFLNPVELFSIPDIFESVIPYNMFPDEMKKGKGDGLVSAESSKIPWGKEHYLFNLNHAEILFNKNVRDTVIKEIEKMT